MSINNFIKRASVRNFTNQKMSTIEMEQIIQVINNSPSSLNHQQFSAIIVTDPKIKNIISINNWNQQHIKDCAVFILFLADRTRMKKIMNNNNLKSNPEFQIFEIVRIITDAVIAGTYTQDALIEMGYGVTIVGGILNFIELLRKTLNIPNSAMPILGLSVGMASKINETKPKMNKVFINKYDKHETLNNQQKYSKDSKGYFQKIGEKEYLEQLTIFLKKQVDSKLLKKVGKKLQKTFDDMFN